MLGCLSDVLSGLGGFGEWFWRVSELGPWLPPLHIHVRGLSWGCFSLLCPLFLPCLAENGVGQKLVRLVFDESHSKRSFRLLHHTVFWFCKRLCRLL